MASDFKCKYSMNAPLTGCKVKIVIKKDGEDPPVMKYELTEKTRDFYKEGEATISDDIVKDVRDLVNRNLVAIRSSLVPGVVTDTSDKAFDVKIDGRVHSFHSENIAAMTKDKAVEEAWVLMVKYLPDEAKEGSKLIFN